MTTKPEDLPFATQPPNPGPKTQHEQSVAGEEDPGSALDELRTHLNTEPIST